MEKINIEKLGEMITEYKDGKPWRGMTDCCLGAKELAEKVNEIINWINDHKDQLLCKCGAELKFGKSHHCNYINGIPIRLNETEKE